MRHHEEGLHKGIDDFTVHHCSGYDIVVFTVTRVGFDREEAGVMALLDDNEGDFRLTAHRLAGLLHGAQLNLRHLLELSVTDAVTIVQNVLGETVVGFLELDQTLTYDCLKIANHFVTGILKAPLTVVPEGVPVATRRHSNNTRNCRFLWAGVSN